MYVATMILPLHIIINIYIALYFEVTQSAEYDIKIESIHTSPITNQIKTKHPTHLFHSLIKHATPKQTAFRNLTY